MLVVFAGVHGSGKSYLCQKLYGFLKNELNSSTKVITLDDISRIRKLKYEKNKIRLLLRYISFMSNFNVLRLLFPMVKLPIKWQEKLLNIKYLFETLIYYELIENYTGESDVILLEEGIEHKIHLLYVTNINQPPETLVKDFLKQFSKADLTIFVNCPYTKNIERLDKRGWYKKKN